jgi:hypothetical protein
LDFDGITIFFGAEVWTVFAFAGAAPAFAGTAFVPAFAAFFAAFFCAPAEVGSAAYL